MCVYVVPKMICDMHNGSETNIYCLQIINDTFTEEFDDMKDKMTEFSQKSQKVCDTYRRFIPAMKVK